MSFSVTFKFVFRNLESLYRAFDQLGWVRDNLVHTDPPISMRPNNVTGASIRYYDTVMIKKGQEEGTYQVAYDDDYHRSKSWTLGNKQGPLNRLQQWYAAEEIRLIHEAEGHVVEIEEVETTKDENELQISVSTYIWLL